MFDNKDLSVTFQIGKTKYTLHDNVREALEDTIKTAVMDVFEGLEKCESPIEQLMCIALNNHKNGLHWRELSSRYEIQLETQIEIPGKDKNHRVDFMITLVDPNQNGRIRFAVECDSKKYHFNEDSFKTDRQRDRQLKSAKIHTLRFTGEEINSSPYGCAAEVYETIYNALMR